MKFYGDQNVFEAALDRIRFIFDEFPNVIVGFSGGKDSTVVFNLTLQVARESNRLPLKVLFIDQEAEWQATIDQVTQVMEHPEVEPLWVQMPIRLFNATSVNEHWLFCWDENEKHRWMREKWPKSIKENVYGTDRFTKVFDAVLAKEFGHVKTALIGGVRTEESPRRHVTLTYYAKYKWITWCHTKSAKLQHYAFYPIYDWRYCCTGEAPIWMGDYSFRRLDQVKVGDEVIGFTVSENGAKSRLVRTKVVASLCRTAPVVKITLASGRTVRCTRDHKWQRRRNPNSTGEWSFGQAEVGDAMAFVVDPMNVERTVDSGWLGGIYDGEGSDDTICQSPTANPDVCKRICEVLEKLGIPFSVNDGRGSGRTYSSTDTFRVMGGRSNLVKFVQHARPVKMKSLDKLILSCRFRQRDRVVSIEPDGVEPVYSLQTESGTYVAWGYASKNCDVWAAIHKNKWPYNEVYNRMYQYGVSVPKMRVSNVHHETAVTQLFWLQELEPDTYVKLTKRISGIDMAGKLGKDDYFVSTLPFMFANWNEYRDFLLEKLIDNPEWKAKFQARFKRQDAMYGDELGEMVPRMHVQSILTNDWEGIKTGNFENSPDHFAIAKRKCAEAKKAEADNAKRDVESDDPFGDGGDDAIGANREAEGVADVPALPESAEEPPG